MFSSSANDDSESLSRCSSASPPGEPLAYYPPQSEAQDAALSASTPSASSTENTQMDVSEEDSFAPTVTTISSTPDLQWLVQPTITSLSPSPGREQSNEAQKKPVAATPKVGGSSNGKKSSRKGKNERLSPEEEEKMKIRRERNKMAAAKCRNRRRELTDTLQAETDKLEEDKATLQAEISSLLKEKKRLEYVLSSHRPTCQMLPDLETMFPLDSPTNTNTNTTTSSTRSGMDPSSPDADPDGLGKLLSMEVSVEASTPHEEEEEEEEEDTNGLQEEEDMEEDSGLPGSSSSSSSCSSSSSSATGLPYSAISGNSNILLCATAEDEEEEEEEEETQEEEEEASDLCDLVPSLEVVRGEEEELLDHLLLQSVSCGGVSVPGEVDGGGCGGDMMDDDMEHIYGGGGMETARSVPDIDLSGTLGLADWETLYRSVAGDLEPLSTPVVNVSTPTCGGGGGGGGFVSVFTFAGCPPDHELDAVPDGSEFLKASTGKTSASGGGGGGGVGGGGESRVDILNSPTLLAL